MTKVMAPKICGLHCYCENHTCCKCGKVMDKEYREYVEAWLVRTLYKEAK